MNFPHIAIKATHVLLRDSLVTRIQTKFESLGKFLKNAPPGTCQVEIARGGKHHKGDIYRAEVTLRYGKVTHRAEATGETIEAAIDIVRNELKEELSRSSEREKNERRRKSKAMKQQP